jgi:hypothetical protein
VIYLGATLVSRDTDFYRVDGLNVTDWTKYRCVDLDRKAPTLSIVYMRACSSCPVEQDER